MAGATGALRPKVQDYAVVSKTDIPRARVHRYYNNYLAKDTSLVVYIVGDGVRDVGTLPKQATVPTSEVITTDAQTIAASGPDHTVFVDTDTIGAPATMTIDDAMAAKDRILVINTGAFDLTLSITGFTSPVIHANDSRPYISDGTDWLLSSPAPPSGALPPVGYTHIQFPFDDPPATLYGGGTWVNISQKAKAYELSTSGWVSREDVGQTLYTETDYAVSDTISGSPGGTYDGETVSTVFTFTGQTIRFEGGNAEAWEEGTQLDAMQRITGTIGGRIKPSTGGTDITDGAFTGSGTASGSADSGTSGFNAYTFDSAGSVSPNPAKTDDDETRMANFTVRAWKRTA